MKRAEKRVGGFDYVFWSMSFGRSYRALLLMAFSKLLVRTVELLLTTHATRGSQKRLMALWLGARFVLVPLGRGKVDGRGGGGGGLLAFLPRAKNITQKKTGLVCLVPWTRARSIPSTSDVT